MGCAAAVTLAEAGARVTVWERDEVAAGASGRNSGVLQRPGDPLLDPLFDASLRWHGLEGAEPSGVLVVATEPFELRGSQLLHDEELRAEEPLLGPGLHGALLADTGHPAPPGDATRALADRARAAGARIECGEAARAVPGGVTVGDRHRRADVVLVCAGAWTPTAAAFEDWAPIRPLWGVVAEIELPARARRPLEERGVDSLLHPDGPPPALFSLVGDVLGSTFDDAEPDADARVQSIRERAARFLPGVHEARVRSRRTCPRPQSADGRPYIGALREDLHVCAGHGAWGVSLGPASGELAAQAILGRATIPRELAADRPCPPPAPVEQSFR